MQTRPTLIDLSHPIESGMPVYPGFPSPRIEPLVSHAASRANYLGQAEFTITRAFLVGNTGTYVDSPWHRYRDGLDLSEISLERLAGIPGRCLEARVDEDTRAARIDLPADNLDGAAVLVRSGWDRRWGGDRYWEPCPYLDGEIVDQLVAAGVALVGVDFWNVDDPADVTRPAHTKLLAAGTIIVEHLRGLDRLPASGFSFYAVPPPMRQTASFPVRAFAAVGGR